VNAALRGPLGAVIVAAGSGRRFGDPAKALALLSGRPLLEYSIGLFASDPTVEQIVVVAGEHILSPCATLIASLRLRDVSICSGGGTRGASVLAGIGHLDPAIEMVAIHDAARPLASPALLRRVVSAARVCGAAVPGLAVADTILEVDECWHAVSAPPRYLLRTIQTPQVARRDWLLSALSDNLDATDEGSLLHRAGHPVQVVEGDLVNLKITYRDDILRAEALMSRPTRSQECE
jgi:2-C-methyl-D-erythritol 4-phosphate cytidylyltransferase